MSQCRDARMRAGEAVEIAKEVLPFRNQTGLAQEIVKTLRIASARNEYSNMAADGGVGGWKIGRSAHHRLGPANRSDKEKIAVAQATAWKRGHLRDGAQDESRRSGASSASSPASNSNQLGAFGPLARYTASHSAELLDQRLVALLQSVHRARRHRFHGPCGRSRLPLRSADDIANAFGLHLLRIEQLRSFCLCARRVRARKDRRSSSTPSCALTAL